MSNETDYAFPHTMNDTYAPVTAGMTLRDYFAAKAMQGLIQRGDLRGIAISEEAYAIADEMLEARK